MADRPESGPGDAAQAPAPARVRERTPVAARVMVADPQPVFVDGISGHIISELGLEALAGPSDLFDLARRVAETAPVVTLIGFDPWQSADADTALAMLRTVAATTQAILVYDHIEPHQAWRALHAGIVGLISRRSPPEDFVTAIRQTLRGGTFLDPTIQEELAALARHDRNPSSVLLTPREQSVLRLSADGLTTGRIATHLALSPSSVKASLHGIYQKLGVHDRPAAVAEALRHGLIT